ncbi:molybdate ABC transporter substrate-binding protein [Rhodoplanes sp. Z2-YC6860]|uniref:molybdate ABC transporter substrate-binding protein n=1 Tax=Rhodoplanes sp. Z2-YC6860 TaxID=674703 RepID=UPI00078C0DE3|nr:molybdate ABC transporter substrate-binding protein [Rhodoplanes sp. Z2-YC6860]AMN42837.1 molybdate ABC transporter periplasmic protein [Rhodoplanes sp. Z2-YC6860]
MRAFMFAVTLALGAVTACQAAEIKVISANGMRDVIADTKAPFESATGHRLTVTVVETGEIRRRVLGGENFDVIIVPRTAADDLEQRGKIVPGTTVALIRVDFGLAVASDGPRPEVSTPEDLKRTLLAAKTVLITDPKTGGVSGVHFMEVLDKLGITEQMKDKLVPSTGGQFHARRVVSGEADIAVQAEHEIRCTRGATFLPYPAVFQQTVTFLGSVGTASKEMEAAKAYLAFLTGPTALTSIKAHCLTPG